ncbi:uncharacterized protein TNIN_380351 [Trichonephila inaurata madagascariensis]|uniref:Uncharacterized protein n=1 Tax=Trichonephila inaurata madagascariensis TaxID=2747483 RepID=A0A8X7BXN1_9ARAC|nr:uncharacterized protein TNIN_380351 [Trichonephila inaurata madagascariensis]
MAYRCDPCNLDFSDFEQYLHHDCKFQDEQILSQYSNNISMYTNAFISFKTSRERHRSNVLVNEGNQCMLTGNSVEDISLIFDFLKCSENSARKETPNEKAALLPAGFNIFGYSSGIQSSTNQKNQKPNLNQLSTSLTVRQVSENYAQNRSNPPSPELSPFPLNVRVLNPYCNTNQEPVSAECSRIKHCYNEMNPQVKPMMYRISSPSQRILYKIPLNRRECTNRNRRTLDFLDRSKIVCEDMKNRNNNRSFQRDVNIALKTQIERDTQNKITEYNPFPMKCSNVYSKKTPTEPNLPGLSLSSKVNENEGNHYDKKDE